MVITVRHQAHRRTRVAVPAHHRARRQAVHQAQPSRRHAQAAQVQDHSVAEAHQEAHQAEAAVAVDNRLLKGACP